MKTIISGRIRSFDEKNRQISIEHTNRVQFYYLQRSLLQKISKYIVPHRFIQFTVTDEERIYRKHKVKTVDYIIKIMEIRYRKNIVYYDVKNIKKGTKALINGLSYKMFLDLEMSMHPYKVDKSFKQEIIQVGYILVDAKDEVVERYNQIIKPTKHPTLSRRTLRFLEITQDDVDKGISFTDFYHHFHTVINTYNPAIIVWGRNDFLALRDGYKINHVKSLDRKTRYINLLKLHKNYFHLKNDLGLLNAYNLYGNTEKQQSHNAYEDAEFTYKIFKGFQNVINHKQQIDISKYK